MEKLYFFRYGSLMYPDGINCRGMDYRYDWNDLIPAMLFGYRRGMFTRAYFNLLYCGRWFGPGDHGFSHCEDHHNKSFNIDSLSFAS